MVADVPTRPGRRPRPIFLLVGVVLAAALGVGLFSSLGASGGRPGPGSPEPAFSLPALGHPGTVSVSAGAGGHPTILLFFASWCTACHAEVPAVAATYRHQRATHSPLAAVRLVGVDGSDPTANALAFVHASGVTFPVAADRTFNVTQGIFEFANLPESVFVTAGGTIAGIHLGALSRTQFLAWEHKLLAS